MTIPSRILIATDLHQRAVLYEALVKLCEEVKPDALILGGDFLHGTGLLPYGRTRQLTPTQCAVELEPISIPVFFVRGNHEDENWFEFRDAWRSLHQKAPMRLNGSFAEIGSVGVIGFPCAMGQEEAFSEGEPLGGEHSCRRFFDHREPSMPRMIQQATQAARTCIPHRGWLQVTVPGLAADRAHSFSPHRGGLQRQVPEMSGDSDHSLTPHGPFFRKKIGFC